MAIEEEHRVTQAPDGSTHTTHVVERRRGGGGGLLIGLAVLLLAAAGIYFLTQMNAREASETAAVNEAAESVGDAADKVGGAVEDAANDLTNSN